jgi:hypothetical protein
MTNWELSRRKLLQALGVGAGCLPLLQATRSYAQAARFPKRFICHLQTEGYRMPAWLPKDGPLASQTLPDSTSPLEPYKDLLIILGNLGNPRFPGCAKWGHGSYGQIFTGGAVDPNSGNGKEYWEPTVLSVDQVIANGIMKAAPMVSRPTLPVEVKVGGGGFPGSKRCFWSGPKQPVTPEPDPYKIYAQVFGGKPPGMMADPATDKLTAERKSLLDFVGKDLERFATRLGNEDKIVIAGHLQSIRDIEKSLAGQKGTIGAWSGDPAKPIDIKANANVPQLLTLHFELMVAALKSDVTRVGTMQFGDATGGAIVFDFVPGVPRMGNGYQPLRDWHDLGHRPVRAGAADGDDKAKVDKWSMGKFAEVLKMLKGTPEGTGTMMDNTLVLWANHMEDGSTHGATKVPWILAGSAQGYFKTGQCLGNSGRAINAVLTEVCNAMDVKVDAFNDPTHGKPFPELRA